MSLPILPAESTFKEQKRNKDDDRESLSLEKGSSIAIDTPAQNAGEYASLHIPWKWKWFALALTCALPIGQTWTDAALGPLKSTLRTELGINNTQYGVIDSAGSIINSIWPLLGGMCLDWFGVSTVSLICTSTIFIGSIIAALAANTGIWRMLVGGHIMMGFGTAVLDSAQHKLFYHFFGASGLAFAFGLESAVAKTISLAAGMSTIPIKETTGWYGWAFWIPVILCGFSLFVNIGYVIWSKTYLPKEFRLTGAREAVLPENRKARFSFKTVMLLPWAFWMLPCTQLFQSEAAGAFGNSATDLIEMRGFTTAVAAF
ncbi:major facilitator superfamily domain-containing protein, partial [Leucosporidium creatinivorum]